MTEICNLRLKTQAIFHINIPTVIGTSDLAQIRFHFMLQSRSHSPSWHRSPLTPGGQRHFPLIGLQVPPFLHLQEKEQFLPNVPSGQAKMDKRKCYFVQSKYEKTTCLHYCSKVFYYFFNTFNQQGHIKLTKSGCKCIYNVTKKKKIK